MKFQFISSSNRRRKYFFGLAVSCAIILSACNDPEKIGLDILPAGDQLNVVFSDSSSVLSETILQDSLLTDENISINLLGSYRDPVFGRTDASFYAQLGFSTNPALGDTSETLSADSMVLTIQYTGLGYGNNNTTMKISVYRLSEAMIKDSLYFSNKTFLHDAQPIGSATFVPHPTDSVSVFGVNTRPHIRIRLNPEFANEIINLHGSTTFENNTNWLSYFKGVFVKTEPVNTVNDGAICYLNLSGTESRMMLYYHSSVPDKDSLSYYFSFNGARANHFDHVYGNTDVGNQLNNPAFNDSINYVQSMAGVRTKISFPFLNDYFANGAVAINKAELTIHVQQQSFEVYPKPFKLVMLAADSAGRSRYLEFSGFASELSLPYVVLNYDASLYHSDIQAYRFNITQHLQKILDGDIPDFGFYLTPTSDVVQGSRLVISSAKNSLHPIKLNITYTKLY